MLLDLLFEVPKQLVFGAVVLGTCYATMVAYALFLLIGFIAAANSPAWPILVPAMILFSVHGTRAIGSRANSYFMGARA